MRTDLIVEILLGLLAIAIGVGSFVGASRAAKVQALGLKRDVEQDAYSRASTIYENLIGSLEGQVTRLSGQVTGLETEVVKLRVSNSKLLVQVSELQETNEALLSEMRGRS